MAVTKKGIFRIIDANLNRSREGLRVCEDIARFILNSKPIAAELKSVRHNISRQIRYIEGYCGAIFDSRNSKSDVGRASSLPGGIKRSDSGDVFIANLQRVKESLRVLEEFAGIFDVKVSLRFSGMRFEVYDIEKRCARVIKILRNYK